jgi:glycosyltransferase involved in cell wall biosynthesis
MDALNSLVNQTLVPSEIVLVKDGVLPQDLEAVIMTFNQSNPNLMKCVSLQKNTGLGNALYVGLKECTYSLIARMDSDDISRKDRFYKQVTYMNNNLQTMVLGSDIEEFNNHPGDLKRVRRLSADPKDLAKLSRLRNPLNHPSVIFRKEKILEVGSYKTMPLFEDYYLWLRIIKSGGEIVNMNETLLDFRVGGGMINRRHGLSYMKKEWHFYFSAWSEGLLKNTDFFKVIILRLPLRLLPLKFMALIYKGVLRK